MMEIPCYILVKNLLTWTGRLAEECVRLGLRPVLFDLESTYPPLLDWYKACPYEVIQGRGTAWCFWRQQKPEGYYVVTDPDLDVSGVPDDCVSRLIDAFELHPQVTKMGLSLEIQDVPDNAMFPGEVKRRYAKYWGRYLSAGVFDAAVDTTFALYHSDRPCRVGTTQFYEAGRLDRPYTARHLPWYLTLEAVQNDQELLYYYQNISWSAPGWSNEIKRELQRIGQK